MYFPAESESDLEFIAVSHAAELHGREVSLTMTTDWVACLALTVVSLR